MSIKRKIINCVLLCIVSVIVIGIGDQDKAQAAMINVYEEGVLDDNADTGHSEPVNGETRGSGHWSNEGGIVNTNPDRTVYIKFYDSSGNYLREIPIKPNNPLDSHSNSGTTEYYVNETSWIKSKDIAYAIVEVPGAYLKRWDPFYEADHYKDSHATDSGDRDNPYNGRWTQYWMGDRDLTHNSDLYVNPVVYSNWFMEWTQEYYDSGYIKYSDDAGIAPYYYYATKGASGTSLINEDNIKSFIYRIQTFRPLCPYISTYRTNHINIIDPANGQPRERICFYGLLGSRWWSDGDNPSTGVGPQAFSFILIGIRTDGTAPAYTVTPSRRAVTDSQVNSISISLTDTGSGINDTYNDNYMYYWSDSDSELTGAEWKSWRYNIADKVTVKDTDERMISRTIVSGSIAIEGRYLWLKEASDWVDNIGNSGTGYVAERVIDGVHYYVYGPYESLEAPYRVEHYVQNVWGGEYVLADTDTGLSGAVGTIPSYTARDYGSGYNLVNVTAPPIEADGSTVVKLYYELLDTIGPVVSVNPTRSINPDAAHDAVKNLDVTISVTEDGSGLAADNVYEYGLSRSQSVPPTSWSTYETGAPAQSFAAAVNIGAGLNGTYYLWVKQISDNAGNGSTSSVMSSVQSYHVCGTYTFDNVAPSGTVSYIENNQTLGIEPESTESYALLQVNNALDAIAGVARIYLKLSDAANPDNSTELDFTKTADDRYELKFYLYDKLDDSEHVDKVNMAVYAVDAVGNARELEIKKYDFGIDQMGNDITADDIAFKKDSSGGYERDYFRIEARVENVSYNATGITFMCGHFGELRIYTFGYVLSLQADFGSIRSYIREQYDSELNLPLTALEVQDNTMYAHRFKIPLYTDYGWYTDTIAYGYKGNSQQHRNVAYNVYDSILLHVKTIYKY